MTHHTLLQSGNFEIAITYLYKAAYAADRISIIPDWTDLDYVSIIHDRSE